MRRTFLFTFALMLAALSPEIARAQKTAIAPSSAKLDPALAAQAKISLDSARTIALHRVAHSAIASEELEREHGRLIYSFDVKVSGKTGIQEVNVNALTGAVVGVHHESAATEAREARDDSVAAARKAASRAPPHS